MSLGFARLSLDRAANVAIIVACLAATALVVKQWRAPAFPVPESYETGDQVAWEQARRPGTSASVAIFIRSTCQFCTNSMPFYAKLAENLEESSSTQLVFVGDEPLETIRTYLSDNGVKPRDIYVLKSPDPKLSVTPTLLVLSGRTVTKSWVGQLSASAERSVFEILGLQPR